MEKYGQISITIGTLGVVIILIGLFPGLIGLEASPGVGVLQVLVILLGFSVLFAAAYWFVKRVFYPNQPTTLAQDIGVRLTLTGLLVAAASGLADVLGFGSHTAATAPRPLLGHLQAWGFVGGVMLASFGVVIYALMGPTPPAEDDEPPDDAST